MKMDIDLDDFKRFQEGLDKLPERVQNRVAQRSVTGAIRKARKNIKAAAPRGDKRSPASEKYGQLHKNTKVGRARTRKRWMKSAFISMGDAFWGFFLEYGTRSIPANPWFFPAFQQSTDMMLSELQDRLDKNIKKEFEKLRP